MGKSVDIHFQDSLNKTEVLNQNCPSEMRTEDNQITDADGEDVKPNWNEKESVDTFTKKPRRHFLN